MLLARGLCDGLITRPEKSYRLWHVYMCDQETSKTRRLNPLLGCENTTKRVVTPGKQTIENLLLLFNIIHRRINDMNMNSI